MRRAAAFLEEGELDDVDELPPAVPPTAEEIDNLEGDEPVIAADFESFEFVVYEDNDYEQLYAGEHDLAGPRNAQRLADGQRHRRAALQPANWFAPFYGRALGVPHPYCMEPLFAFPTVEAWLAGNEAP